MNRDVMDRYQKVRVVGKGAFGAAILVNARSSGKQYVIKQVDVSRMKPKEHDEAKKEIKLLAAFNHPNIVRYRDSFIESGALHIVMDFCEGGELHVLLKERKGAVLSEQQVRFWLGHLRHELSTLSRNSHELTLALTLTRCSTTSCSSASR